MVTKLTISVTKAANERLIRTPRSTPSKRLSQHLLASYVELEAVSFGDILKPGDA
jgi:hypothetical protein